MNDWDSPGGKTNREIVSDVINALRQDSRICIDSLGVSVNNGVVRLSGVTKWEADCELAVETVYRVEGVKEVVSNIDVWGG